MLVVFSPLKMTMKRKSNGILLLRQICRQEGWDSSKHVVEMSETNPTKKQNREDAEVCAGYLKALGDSNRLQIIKALQSSPFTVTDLSLLLDSEMANVSHHLRVLFHAGLVTTTRDGKFIYYQINREVIRNKTVAQALDFGCCRLDMRSAR